MLDQTSIFEAVRVADKKVYKVQKKKDFYWYEIGENEFEILYYQKGLVPEEGYLYYEYYIDGILYNSFMTNVLHDSLADYHMKAEKPSSDVQLSLF